MKNFSLKKFEQSDYAVGKIGKNTVLTIPKEGGGGFETVLLSQESKEVIKEGELLLLSLDGISYAIMGEGKEDGAATVCRISHNAGETGGAVSVTTGIVDDAAVDVTSDAASDAANDVTSDAASDIVSDVTSNADVTSNMANTAEDEREPYKIQRDDVMAAMKIALAGLRWSKYLFKSVRQTYYDEKLAKAVKKIDNTYLAPLIFVFGTAAVCLVTNEYLGLKFILPVLVLWIMIDCILINTLIYLIGLPKPINSHIKKIEKNTEKGNDQWYEIQRMEKILKKYK